MNKGKMQAIYGAGLPGFYIDGRGAYGIVIGRVYICCFINSDDGKYDVTVDTIDANGDFAMSGIEQARRTAARINGGISRLTQKSRPTWRIWPRWRRN